MLLWDANEIANHYAQTRQHVAIMLLRVPGPTSESRQLEFSQHVHVTTFPFSTFFSSLFFKSTLNFLAVLRAGFFQGRCFARPWKKPALSTGVQPKNFKRTLLKNNEEKNV